MTIEYRDIDWRVPTVVYATQLETVKNMLETVGFDMNPTRIDDVSYHIHPLTKDLRHWRDIQVFRDIAPYLSGGHAIMEVRESGHPVRCWLHLIYENGEISEIETPPHQWEV